MVKKELSFLSRLKGKFVKLQGLDKLTTLFLLEVKGS